MDSVECSSYRSSDAVVHYAKTDTKANLMTSPRTDIHNSPHLLQSCSFDQLNQLPLAQCQHEVTVETPGGQ